MLIAWPWRDQRHTFPYRASVMLPAHKIFHLYFHLQGACLESRRGALHPSRAFRARQSHITLRGSPAIPRISGYAVVSAQKPLSYSTPSWMPRNPPCHMPPPSRHHAPQATADTLRPPCRPLHSCPHRLPRSGTASAAADRHAFNLQMTAIVFCARKAAPA